ncbi:MFS transporter [Roseospira marina]|uniref:MFS transporter n=1 Tax=Roseospira marina TaxID=140057 RepID=A0A5M6IEH8_9PROT|nr:MFS transporter [Roseospira marina]KAA5606696.1 MFS transporter [Roseospira marina]MBB4313891.1 MFS family permease [Roseospira marina]MBB5087053.1 MFS family permease [Roseospira marina]
MPAAPEAARSLFIVVGATTLIQALVTLNTLTVATLGPEITGALGVPPETVGYQMSLVYFCGAFSAVLAGGMVTRHGAGRTSQIALVLGGLGCALGATGSLWALVPASALIGTGYGMTNPASSHILFRFTPARRRNLIFSLKQTGVPLGGVLAGLMLPAVGLTFGWQAGLAVSAALALTMTALLQTARPAWDDDRRPGARSGASPLSGLALIWRHDGLRAVALMTFCFAAVQLCLTTFMVTLLVEGLDRSLVLAGAVASMAQIAGALGRVFWGWLADRLGGGLLTLAIIGLISLVCAVATGFMTPAWPTWSIAALLTAFGISAIGWNGVFLAEVARLCPPGQVGLATGGALFFTFGGVAVGPALFSALVPVLGGYAATFPAIGLFALAGTVLIGRARHHERATAA